MTADVGIHKLIQEEDAKLSAEAAAKNGRAAAMAGAEFSALGDDRYRLSLPAIGVTFAVDRLRREYHELQGELSVRCDLPGASPVGNDKNLSIADFNFSSARARQDRAKLLAGRANTGNHLDWFALVEEFSQKVLEADRTGQPAQDLRTFEEPAPDDDFEVEGLQLLKDHPVILFGDGGAAKSYLALYLAGRLAERGLRVGVFDWELSGPDHKVRLRKLFPDGMPLIFYVRCTRPLTYEADRLKRIVRENRLDYCVFDSVAYAVDGPPESAEIAARYFRSVRGIGGGGIHVAHISKAEGADQKPFGSAFWHNSARATWFAAKAEETPDGSILRLGLFQRKNNLGRLRPPIAFTITFEENRTTFRRSDVADNPDLAAQMSIRQRMAAVLRKGAMAPEEIARELEAKPETVNRTARRYKNLFVLLPGGKWGLLERMT